MAALPRYPLPHTRSYLAGPYPLLLLPLLALLIAPLPPRAPAPAPPPLAPPPRAAARPGTGPGRLFLAQPWAEALAAGGRVLGWAAATGLLLGAASGAWMLSEGHVADAGESGGRGFRRDVAWFSLSPL